MSIRILAATFFLAVFSPISEAKINLENTANSTELEKVQGLTAEIFRQPSAMAKDLSNQLNEAPEYGWQSTWMLQLKALDLVGYYFSVEKNQFYSSAGRWTPPKHVHKDAHLHFYQTVINPQSAPYSEGLSHSTIYVFAGEFLNSLMSRKNSPDVDLIKTLAQTDREFWSYMILKHVFTHPNADTAFMKDLIFAFAIGGDYTGRINYTDLVSAIFTRQQTRTISDAEELLSVVYGRINVFSEIDIAEIFPHHFTIRQDASCVELLESVDRKHMESNGGKSVLRR